MSISCSIAVYFIKVMKKNGYADINEEPEEGKISDK
jgi:hypothetical protein